MSFFQNMPNKPPLSDTPLADAHQGLIFCIMGAVALHVEDIKMRQQLLTAIELTKKDMAEFERRIKP